MAPVAFFAAVTVLVLIVQSALEQEETDAVPVAESGPIETAPDGTATSIPEDAEQQEPEPPEQEEPAGEEQEQEQEPEQQRYTVRSGDTLESIADRTNTTVEDLLRLNPDIDPLALTPGQEIRIR